MKKSVKVVLFISIVFLTVIISAIIAYFAITSGINLDKNKLIDYGKTITVYDCNGEKIQDASCVTKRNSVNLAALDKNTVNAFIASEDRTFYKHNGLNYKRMAKALYKNIRSRSFKEGASTISQQLIKNTHLCNDKTITRKLKEIKLTRQLEKRYSKDDILEMYLNTIYFGHNCYGLENAANFYFGKKAEDLTLSEGAALAGLLSSPNNFSPIKNPQKCLQKRNAVLKSMSDCNFIDEITYQEAIKAELKTEDNEHNYANKNYVKAVFEELESCNIDPYSYRSLSIKTYLDPKMQATAEKQSCESDSAIIIRNKNGGICAFTSSIGQAKRQIGSTAKPIFVYAPAIEEKKLNIFTKIKDEPVAFNGYKPENYDRKYHGSVSAEECIKHSYNIPAVKTLNSVTIKNAVKYAEKMNVELSEEDKNLSLALGGMKDGLSIKELCDCYSVFQNGGEFMKSAYINEITDETGKTIYGANSIKTRVFSKGTCSLINRALIETVKSGTAKKLKNVNLDVACKTGTCGTKEGNTDAYAVLYTSRHTMAIWLGDRNNKKLDITGGRDCCNIANSLLAEIYSNESCPPLDVESEVEKIKIDREEYEKNDKILLCDDNCPKLNILNVYCLKSNVPKEQSTRFSQPKINKPSIFVNNNAISIILCQTKYYDYIIERKNNGNIDILYNGKWIEKFSDSPPDGEYEYSVTPYYSANGKKFYGEKVLLPRVKIAFDKPKKDDPPNIALKDWFNL